LTIQTVSFTDASPGVKTEVSSSYETTFSHGSTTDVPLADFLSRPVKIFEYAWDTASQTNLTFYPWKEFLETTAIRARAEGYRFVRGKLHLRAMVTGNPLLFGRNLIGYEPWADRNNFNYGNPIQRVHKTCVSQFPHIELDATTSTGGEMVLPFFSPYNWICLTDTNMLQDMGKCYVINLATLRHANSPTGSAHVIVHAWMEDVELAAPTVLDYGGETYQGESDEYKSGLISKPATAIARIANSLSKIPVIRPYALATEMAASTTAGIASAFGFSRPQILDNTRPVRELAAGRLAATNEHEVVSRLALDSKSQLSVDPRTVGLDGTDEMSLRYVLGRETWLYDIPWAEAENTGDLLFHFRVTPTYHTLDLSTTPPRSAIPPCTAVASMFRYWRGTMVYRFSVVASALHRGKIQITYEPSSSLAAGNTHTTYTRIIDIAETRDFEIPVHWHCPTPWQQVKLSEIGGLQTHYSAATPTSIAGEANYFNGSITVSVLTPLTSPDPSLVESVKILWYVRGGDDLEFANPIGGNAPFTYRSTDTKELPQGLPDFACDEIPQGDITDLGSDQPDVAPNDSADVAEDIGTSAGTLSDPLSHVFHGETVTSLRSFLKRYRVVDRFGTTKYPTLTQIPIRSPITSNAGMTIPEFVFHWYVGWRGSIRQKHIATYRDRTLYTARGYSTVPNNDYIGSSGAHINFGLSEIEIPFYSYKRFEFTRWSPTWTNNNTDTYSPNNVVGLTGTLETEVHPVLFCAAVGDDFSLFHFQGIPPVYAV
jgi:hypothetical protein